MAEAKGPEHSADAKGDGRVVIKKYANRRLYNTASSSYVTLDHLSEMVKQGVDFVVYDAKTNDDITRSVLAQIIFDEEGRGQNLLPIPFLRQLIGFYGNSMQALLPSYLELSLDSFTKQQEQMRQQMGGALGGTQGLQFFEDQVKQNVLLFERAMKMFSPFAFGAAPAATAADPAPAAPPAASPAADAEALSDLKKQLSMMQQQLEKLASKE